MTTVTYPHIELRDGMAYIAGTRMKVIYIVLAKMAFDWDAEQIQRQHPDLTLSEIHSALAFYYENQQEMDRIIEERLRLEDKLIAELGPSPARAKLLAAKYGKTTP
jgi:uncharacterized protein (DUF433 family)